MKLKFSNFLVSKLILIIFLTIFSISAKSQITIDGNTNDWANALNTQPLSLHIRDANTTNDDSFTGGSSDPNLISGWTWENGQTNDKGDISNAAAVLIGNKLYFAGDRTAINGSAQIGFWFFKNGVGKNPNGTFSGQHEVGDLLVLSNFTNGGGVVQLRVYKWVGSGGSDGTLDLIATTFDGFVNSTYQNTPNYPNWTYQGKNVPSVGVPPPNTYATGAFIEGFIDLGQYNFSPCFSSFLLETRNSPSVTAALQDFAGGQFNVVPSPPTVTDGSRCGAGLVTLSASCTNGSGVKWYSSLTSALPLTAADGVSSDGNSLTVNVNQDVTYYVACIRDGVPCESKRVPVKAKVNKLPVVELIGGPVLCNDQPVVLTANVTNSTGTINYEWYFNGVVLQGQNQNQLSAYTTGTYQVKVKDGNSCPAESNTITLNNPTKVTVELSGGSILCHDDSVTLTATANGGTGNYTYSWFKDGQSIAGTGNSISVNSSGVYSVKVNDGNNCGAESNVITLTNPTQVAVTLSGGPILCHDDSVTLNASANGGTGIYTYSWFKDGQPIAGTGNSISVNSSGAYSVKVKDGNNCGADSNNITLTNPTQVSVTLSGGPILCHDDSVTLTASANGGTGSYTYSWFKDGQPIAGSGSSISVNSSGAYSVKVKDGNSCGAESNVITLTNPTQVAVTLSGGPILCHDDSVTLTASANGGTGSYTYSWFKDGQPIAGSGSSISVNSSGAYSVKVKDGNSCGAESNIITLTNPTQVTVTLSGGPILCHDDSVTLTASANGGTGSYTYSWFKDGQPIAGTGNSISVNASGVYSVKVEDGNNCGAESNVITLKNPTQVAVTLSGGPIVCHDDTVTLSASANGGTGSYTYSWFKDGQQIAGTGNSISVNSSGAYSVKVKDGNNCPAESNIVNLVNPEQLVVSIAGGNFDCTNTTVVLTANASGGTAPYSYQWYRNGLAILNATGQLYTATQSGDYTVTLKDKNKCSVNSAVKTLTLILPINFTVSADIIACDGTTTTATVKISGALVQTPPYIIVWKDSNGQVVSNSNTAILGYGNYTVEISREGYCTAIKTLSIAAPEPCPCLNFTLSAGAWGQKDNSNWGRYRNLNFSKAFPNGLLIGSNTNGMRFTDSPKLGEFINGSGGPSVAFNFGKVVINPAPYKNQAARQLLALMVTNGFSRIAIAPFGNYGYLGDMMIVQGGFSGMTVDAFIALANAKISNPSTPKSELESIASAAESFNLNFHEGTVNNGNLGCPLNNPITKPGSPAPKPAESLVIQTETKVQLYPNPTNGVINVKFDVDLGSTISVMLYDASGKVVADLSRNAQRSGRAVIIEYQNYNLPQGMYLIKVKTSNFEKTFKVIKK